MYFSVFPFYHKVGSSNFKARQISMVYIAGEWQLYINTGNLRNVEKKFFISITLYKLKRKTTKFSLANSNSEIQNIYTHRSEYGNILLYTVVRPTCNWCCRFQRTILLLITDLLYSTSQVSWVKGWGLLEWFVDISTQFLCLNSRPGKDT